MAVALDADTGKPLDPKVGMRVKREFYNVKQSPNGKKVMVAHKTRSNASGEAKNDKNNEGAKKVGNEKGGNEKGGQGKKNDGGGGGGGGDKVNAISHAFTTRLGVLHFADLRSHNRRTVRRHGPMRRMRSSKS